MEEQQSSTKTRKVRKDKGKPRGRRRPVADVLIVEEPHKSGSPSLYSAPRPSQNFVLRLTAEERGKVNAIASERQVPCSRLIREAMRIAGLI